MSTHHVHHGLNTSVPDIIKKEYRRYQGRVRKRLSLWQAVALIVSSTIGAGIIGLPYAISLVGPVLGVVYLVVFGLLMMYMNLLVGEIAIKTHQDLQLVGLAKRYLGSWGKYLMLVLMYFIIIGALVVYIIGTGESLAALLPGGQFMWSLIFFGAASLVIFKGMSTLKTIELVLMVGILAVVTFLSLVSLPAIEMANFSYIHVGALLAPYGVALFSFHGAVSIPEAHILLKDNNKDFRKAIIYSSIINIIIYVVFSLVIVGVTGTATTQVATIGLGEVLGPVIFTLGNIFAVLAMGTSFLILSIALRNSIQWDLDIKPLWAGFIAMVVPLLIFLAGMREFIRAIDIVGGVLISIELLLLLLIYWRSQKIKDQEPTEYIVRFLYKAMLILLAALLFGVIYSIVGLM